MNIINKSGPVRDSYQRGFTLIEVAIVLLILTIILGYSVAMWPRQQELKQHRAALSEMEAIIEHLVAFAQVNGRLPCPDTANVALDGREDRSGGNSCSAFFGFVPGRTLGMEGDYDQNNVLMDPWNAGYGYAVSPIQDGVPNRVFVTANGIRDFGVNATLLANAANGLYLCDDNINAPANDTSCTSVSGDEVLGSNGEVAAVIISLGRDNAIPATSNVQRENLDGFNIGTSDRVYIVTTPRDDYDDLVRWVPTSLLFSKMIAAERLP